MEGVQERPDEAGGGFILPSLPSPPYGASEREGFDPSLRFQRALPSPRPTPLRAGSRASRALITYLDDGLRIINGKYARKFTPGGYRDIKTIVSELATLVDLIWVSSTPSLQISYLLQIANSFNDYLASFALDLKSTFTFLDQLDRCFYILLTGSPVAEGTPTSPSPPPLPPHMAIKHLTTTEKVRLQSIIVRTRLHCVKLMEDGPTYLEEPDIDEGTITPVTESESGIVERQDESGVVEQNDNTTSSSTDNMDDEDEDDDENEEWEMAVARVYHRSLEELSEQLRQVE